MTLLAHAHITHVPILFPRKTIRKKIFRSEAARGQRRNILKGQQAIALALLYPEPEHGGARKKGSSSEAKLEGFSKARLSQARAILAHSREPGQRAVVVAKVILLSNNLQTKAAVDSGISQTRVSQANVVLRFAPERADQVLAGDLPLNDAYVEARARGRGREGALTL